MTLDLHLAALVLLAAVVHATWNAVVKAAGDRVLTFTVILATGTVLGLAVAPFVALPQAAAWPYLVASSLVHNAYYVVLLLAYRVGDLSQVYPLARGTAPLVVAVLAALFAGETMGAAGAAGVGLVSLGIVSLTFAAGTPRGEALRPVFLAVLTGLLIASYTVVDGLGMRRAGTPWGYIVWLNLLEGLPFMAVVPFLRRGAVLAFARTHWVPGVGGGGLAILAYGLVLYALSQGPMAYVSALRETSVLVAAVIGSLALGEQFGRRRIAAAAIIVAGLAIIQLAG